MALIIWGFFFIYVLNYKLSWRLCHEIKWNVFLNYFDWKHVLSAMKFTAKWSMFFFFFLLLQAEDLGNSVWFDERAA